MDGIGANAKMSAFDCYKDRFDPTLTLGAYGISKKVLTLPMYGALKKQDLDVICDTILEARQ